MTVLPVATAHVTDALVFMLATVTGLPVGDGDGPKQTEAGKPWAIVEVIPGGGTTGDVATPDGETTVVYQVTSVGATRLQAESMRDRCHRAILERSPDGGFVVKLDQYTAKDTDGTARWLGHDQGLVVADREHDSTGGIAPEGIVFNAVERYRLWVLPA